ncbi:PepSY-associated TM helix domain-containing protein [Bradyrhizobium sp. LHD-71]|uniref:PepSY-associated TM helix domain-containing protein n=1 Tax=Bradyrhizobium sp. LHD-71 TaxID=3072141 RepID=UPI00280F5A62|nr:PepSY-associated TM helix domain-containing protein [Bradyrhizobium sp. LHD-71]MDQ8731840.1 PepSY-associated TM helix domain-containing protein [Bradyrhizobium sp. LHD-71]
MRGLSAASVRRWSFVHKWTSLVATAFLLMLCLTGLPLVFHQEIDDWLDPRPELAAVAPDTGAPTLDAIVAETLAKYPGDVMVSLGFVSDRPAVLAQSAPTVRTPFKDSHQTTFDLRTGALSDQRAQTRGAFTDFIRSLHTDMFAGLYGSLFLGAMALTFIASLVSGLVVYAPFMRRLPFGALRRERSRPLYWLDLHNLVGAAIAVWMLVVGATGAVNTLHDIVAAKVRAEIFQMSKRHGGATPASLSSVDRAIATARTALPGGKLVSFFFPGAGFSTPHHYAVFARGDRPITAKLFYVALIDAETGELSDVLDMPWYAKALLLSQPLHFGDYGGLPLKIIWALLDVLAIVVLVSGLYLWLRKHRLRADHVIGIDERRGATAAS